MLVAALATVLLASGSPDFLVGTSPHLSQLVEAGLRDSPTFRETWDALRATQAAQLTLVHATADARSRVRSKVEIWTPASRDDKCVAWLRAQIGVPAGGLRGRRVALLAHELVHLLRIFQGSRDERAGTTGERVALEIEQRVADEMDAAARGRRREVPPELVAKTVLDGCDVTGELVPGPTLLLH